MIITIYGCIKLEAGEKVSVNVVEGWYMRQGCMKKHIVKRRERGMGSTILSLNANLQRN